MAARAGASSGARQGAKKWLASFFGDGVEAATAGASHAGAATPKSVAKERLQIILAHQRGSQVLAGVDLQALQQELLQCVQRHIRVANGANINIAVKQEGQLDIFEMQVPVDGNVAQAMGTTASSQSQQQPQPQPQSQR